MISLDDLRMIRKYAGPYLSKIALIAVLGGICAFFEAVSLGALVPLIQLMEDPTAPGGTLWGILQKFFDTTGVPLTLITLLTLLAGLFLVGQALLYLKKAMQVQVRVGLVADLKTRLFGEILTADIAYHNAQKTGNLLNVLNVEVDNVGYGLFAGMELLTDVFFIGVYALMLLYISVELTVICLVITLFSVLVMNTVLQRSTTYGKELLRWNTLQSEFLSERFSLLRLIKTSVSEIRETGLFGNLAEQYKNAHSRYGITGVQIEIIFQSLIFILAVLVLALALEVFGVPLAMLFVFLFILVRITAPLRDFNARRHELAREIPSIHKIDQNLNEAGAFHRIVPGTTIFRGFQHEIAFSHVDFSYLDGTPVLSDVSIRFPKNQFIALVGPSGGGKSTVADLLVRLLDPDQGEITVDGKNLKDFDIRSYRQKLGVVSQEIFLFDDTVLANICYGSDEVSPERAAEAATMANAHEFIQSLPEGYRTVVGERGVSLSGGQRQRIALARALYKRPEILILDEATSSLDSESERIIQTSIMRIRDRYTIVVIAHRLSTIEASDCIYVIERGRITDRGTHADLLSRSGPYATYHQIQYGVEEGGGYQKKGWEMLKSDPSPE
jgi:ATP-binding cassette, subfamily B, bacterial MsbA